MASFNKSFLLGNLTRDPELRYTSGGQAVCNFTIAMNRRFKSKDSDEYKEETTFQRVTVWGKQGENCAQYLAKGRAAFVSGRIQNREWETEEGEKKYATDVIADEVQFLGGRSDDSESDDGEEKPKGKGKKPAAKGKGKGKASIPF